MLYFNERFSMGYFCCYFSTCFREKSRYHNFGKQNSICFLAVLGNIMLFDSDWLCYFCDSIPCRKLDTLLAETASHRLIPTSRQLLVLFLYPVRQGFHFYNTKFPVLLIIFPHFKRNFLHQF